MFTGALVVAAVLGLIALAGSWWTVPAAAATVLGTLLAGRFLAWLGPVLLGPSYAERLQRLEADAARATERNRIAREIHDSVGHALSVVTMQASAARKLIERDPGFAADALATIETTSRRAASELDEMLGLLRDETRRPAAPAAGPGLPGRAPDHGPFGWPDRRRDRAGRPVPAAPAGQPGGLPDRAGGPDQRAEVLR